MRRDYFTCVFLLCVCASLFFVCFVPLYYTYGLTIPRDFSVLETICSWIYAVSVIVLLPVYAAWRKRPWISFGLAAYGLLAYIPGWFLPGLAEKVSGSDASLPAVVINFLLRCIYGMVNAPFAALTPSLGADSASTMSRKILPVALIVYAVVKIFRFYRDAYLNEKLDPSFAVDNTAASSDARKVRDAHIPDILGTVISAPVRSNTDTGVAAPQQTQPQAAPSGPSAAPSSVPSPSPAPAVKAPSARHAVTAPQSAAAVKALEAAERPVMRQEGRPAPRRRAPSDPNQAPRPVTRRVDQPRKVSPSGASADEAIQLPPPKKTEEAIQLPPPKNETGPDVIELGPPKKQEDVIELGPPAQKDGQEAPKAHIREDGVIELPPPKNE